MPGTIVIGLIFAATHFIVPVEGQTTDRKWEATLVVTNAGSEPITLTVDAIYPLMGDYSLCTRQPRAHSCAPVSVNPRHSFLFR